MSASSQTVKNIVAHCMSECETGDINIARQLLPMAKKLIQACWDVTPPTATEALSELRNLSNDVTAAHKMLLQRLGDPAWRIGD